MDKKIAALIGAAGCLALSAPASYAELLNPIPNAAELLKADNAAQAARVQPAAWFWDGYQWQWREPVPPPDEPPYYDRYRHHHHHHNHWYHHHHHHHHYRDW